MRKATGIVRKVDELGRFVIPKELRRTMRIKEGDLLEIYTDDDADMVLKKYSPIEGIGNRNINEYIKTLHQIFGEGDVLICDRNKICASAGTNQEHYMNKELHHDISCFFKQDKYVSVLLHGNDKINVTVEDKEFTTQMISLIRYGNHDIAGAVISLLAMADYKAEILDYMSKATSSMACLIGNTIYS